MARQRDVRDRRVQDDHELRGGDDEEREAEVPAARGAPGASVPSCAGVVIVLSADKGELLGMARKREKEFHPDEKGPGMSNRFPGSSGRGRERTIGALSSAMPVEQSERVAVHSPASGDKRTLTPDHHFLHTSPV